MSILDIGKFLRQMFDELGINIYPSVAENSAKMPFAVYRRMSTDHNHKDQRISQATYLVEITADQYDESVALLQKVIDSCGYLHEFEGTAVRLIVESTVESYGDRRIRLSSLWQSYIQSITLKIEI
jgi:hypothetical protein